MKPIRQIRIKGDFKGWNRGNVYKFEDGERWRQVSAEYEHAYEESPEGTLLEEGARWYLELECMDTRVQVRKVGYGGR